jgi:hypothetical protein
MAKIERTFQSIANGKIRLYNDGCLRVWLGEGATEGNGSDVAPGETIPRVAEKRAMLEALSPEDRTIYDAWKAEQNRYPSY